jgi:hypothetical protein
MHVVKGPIPTLPPKGRNSKREFFNLKSKMRMKMISILNEDLIKHHLRFILPVFPPHGGG